MDSQRRDRLRVLVVDDDADTRAMYAMALTLSAFDVLEASDGAEAMARASELQPDVIVTDLSGPQLDGYELIAWLHANPQTSSIPVIVLTGWINATTRARAAEAGVDFITKPCTPDTLIAEVLRARLGAGQARGSRRERE